MKIYISHSSSLDYKNELYAPIRTSEMNSLHKFVFPHEQTSAPVNSKQIIKACDVVVAEVSHPSTGQGIELGWAEVYGRPIICIYRDGASPSSSVKLVATELHSYTDKDGMIALLSSALERF